MKKIIAMLLALLMISTAVITVSANTTTPDAPVVRGVQTKVDGAVSVRFLSTVHSTDGDAVGYVIKATFLDGSTEVQSFTYSKAEGDDAMESSTIYASVMQNNTPVSAVELAEGDESAEGIFAAVISGIPATEDVLFEVVSYVRVGDTYNYSKPTYEKLSNGEMRQLTSGYEKDYTNLADSHVANRYGGNMTYTFADDKLTIPTAVSWSSKPNYFLTLVDNDVFTSAPEKYMVNMDIELSKLGCFALVMNSKANNLDDSVADFENGILVTMRMGSSKGTYVTKDVSDAYDIYFRTGRFNETKSDGKADQVTDNGNDCVAYAIPDQATKASFKLTVVVDSSPADGCRVSLYIDGTYIYSYDNTNVHDVSTNSAIVLWAQDTICTIDNLEVSTVSGDITTSSVPTAGNQLYFENYNYDLAKTPGYNSPNLKLEDGKLVSHGGEWNKHSTIIANSATYSDCYVFEAQLDLTKAGTSLLLFNNAGDATTAADFHKYAFAIRFEWSNETGYGFFVRKYDDVGGQISTNIVDADALTSTFPGLNYQNFKLTVIVDSTHDEGCLVTVLTNDQYMTSFALDGNYDVKADNAIELWTQGTTNVGISNIAVKNYLQVNN